VKASDVRTAYVPCGLPAGAATVRSTAPGDANIGPSGERLPTDSVMVEEGAPEAPEAPEKSGAPSAGAGPVALPGYALKA